MGFKNFLHKLKGVAGNVAGDIKEVIKDLAPAGDADEGESLGHIDLTTPKRPDPPTGTAAGNRATPPQAPGRGNHEGSLPLPPPPHGPTPLSPSDQLRLNPTGVAGLHLRKEVGDSDPNRVVVASPEDSLYVRRTAIVDDIRHYYVRFGDKVAAAVLSRVLMPDGMRQIMAKLELRFTGRVNEDHAAVVAWIDRRGVDEFCLRLKIRRDDSSSPQAPAPTPSSGPRYLPDPPTGAGAMAPGSVPKPARSTENAASRTVEGGRSPTMNLNAVNIQPISIPQPVPPTPRLAPPPVPSPQGIPIPPPKPPTRDIIPPPPNPPPAPNPQSASEFLRNEIEDSDRRR